MLQQKISQEERVIQEKNQSYLVENLKQIIDVDKPKPVLIDLCKVHDVADNDFVERTVCDKLVIKVNAVYSSGYVYKTQ